MRKNKFIIFLICIILCLFALNGAFASDINDETIFNEEMGIDYQLNDDINDERLLSNNEDDLDNNIGNDFLSDDVNDLNENDIGNGLMSNGENDLLNDNSNSFSALNQTINGNQDDSVYLNADYTFNGESDSNLIQGIPIERNLTVYGNGHTLNANGQSRIFNILDNKATVVFKDLIFINGNGTNGGAIYGKSSAINCTFRDNTADKGGAIYAQSNNFDIINCTFEGNIAKENGGAIYLDSVSGSTINNSVFKGNKAKNGGALSSEFSQRISISSSNFTDNEASLNGGAIDYYFSITLMINFCRFENNIATGENGGAISFVLSKGNISNNRFDRNSAKENGGAIYIEIDNSSSMVQGQHLSECNFTSNNAKNGGAIYNNDFYVISDGTMRFSGNFADENGGAVYCKDNCVFDNSRFATNSALGNGGAIYCGDRCRFIGSTFLGNEATGNGGAVYANDRPYIEKSNFTLNEAKNGGAIYCRNSSTFIDSSFLRNLAVKDGGAVYSSDNAFFMDSNFTENKAANGGAAYGNDFSNFYRVNFIDNFALENGSAAYGHNNNSFNEINFTGNNASYGAVYCLEGNRFLLCEFVNNTAHSGSAIYMDRYNSINDSTFLSNKADPDLTRYDDDLNLTFSLEGSNKFINAIYSFEIFDYSNITYWAGEIVNSNDVPITYGCPGINFTIDIYDSDNNLINRTVLQTDEIGHFNFDYSFLDGGSYTCLVYHEEDDYYYSYSSNFTLSFGDFTKLQYLLRKSNDNGIINLTENYTRSDLDDIYSIVIPWQNITINGNGFVIDSANKYIVLGTNRKVSIKFLNCTFANELNLDFSYMENVSFIDCNFINSSALRLYQVENAQIVNCTFVNASSGIYADYGGNLEIINCSFENSTGATYGGASRFEHNDNVTLIDCNFTGNNARNGGAIYTEKDNLNLVNCTFRNNIANYGGAIDGWQTDIDLQDCSFFNNSANDKGGAIYSSEANLTVLNNEFVDNSAKEAGAIFTDYGTFKNSRFLNNKASSISLDAFINGKSNLTLTFKGNNTYINAISSTGDISFENVTYWNGEIVNSDDVSPIENTYPGVSIAVEIYDDEDNLVKNVTVLTDDESRAYYDLSELDNGNYRYDAYHLDDGYYSFIGECNGSFVIDRATSSVSIKIDNQTQFVYNECTIPFEIINRTVARVIITNYDGSEVFVNQTTDDDFIVVDLKPNDEYYLITVINLPTTDYERSEDSKLFKIIKPGSSVTIDPISDIVYGENLTVSFNVENKTMVNITVLDSNNVTVFTINTTNDSVALPILPVGTYNITVLNYEDDIYTGSSSSLVFNVLKAPSSIKIDPISDIVYGENITVSFVVENRTAVNLTVLDANNVSVFSVNTNDSSVALPVLPSGVYAVTAVNVENEFYNESRDSVVFNVLKAASSITIDPIADAIYGDNITVNFAVENRTVVNVTVWDKENIIVFSVNATGDSVALPVLPSGVYAVTAVNVENEFYNESSDFVVFNVIKAASSISVDPIADIPYNNEILVNFVVENLTMVNVTVRDKDNSTVYSANVTDNFTIPVLPVGAYNLTLVNVENENYTESSCSVLFNVVTAGSSITLNPIDVAIYGENITASFVVENRTVVNLTVRDKDNLIVFSVNATGDSVDLPILAAGTYSLTVVNVRTESYGKSSDSINFTILKAASSISLDSIADVVYGNNVSVSFSVDNLTVVSVAVLDKDNNNTVFSKEVMDNFTISGLAAGTYNITLRNLGNENYTESNGSAVFNVVKAGSSISVDPIADIVYGNDVSVIFSGENLTVVNVTVLDKDNKTVYSANITESPLILSGLAAGTYNITLRNLGNENYTGSNGSAVFNVVKAGSSISVDPIADIVYGNDVSVIFSGENLTVVNVTVLDKDNNTVYSANVTDNFTISGLAVGAYNITLRNMGNENYTESSSSVAFSVVKAGSSISVDPIADIVYGNDVSVNFAGENLTVVNVTVRDKDNNILDSFNVTDNFTFSGLAVGTYNITLMNLGNETHMESSCNVVFSVVKAASSISVDPIGERIYGENITVSFSGENLTVVSVVVLDKNNNTVYSANVSSKIFTIPVLPVGVYNITLRNLGDENHNESSASAVFTVMKAASSISLDSIDNLVYGDNVSVSFSGENLTVVNVTVMDNGNNVVYSANVTDNFTISGLAAGDYNIILRNLGDENHNESSVSAVFTVVKAASSIIVDSIDNLVYGDNVSVSFSGENLTVVNVTVMDKDNNIVYSTSVTDNFTIPGLAAGAYNLTLRNEGNENYSESSVSAVFTVVKAASSIIVDPIADTPYNNTVPVNFVVENLTVVNVTVRDKDNNTVYSTSVSDNFTIPVLPVGTYNLTLVNLENENYTGDSCSVLFNVVKAGSSITVNPIGDAIYGENIAASFVVENRTVVNVTVRDKDNLIVFSVNATGDSVDLPILAAGTYNITAVNVGTESYGESSDSINFTILKAASSINVDPIADVVYGNNVSVIFSGDNLTEVNVNVVDKDNKTVYSANVTDNFTISGLAVGVYNITLRNVESESYRESSDSAVFTIVKAGSSISIDPIGSFVYGDNISIGFDVDNLTVVNVTVVDKNNITVFSGEFTESPVIISGLDVGTYNITLRNVESESYRESSDSAVFLVVTAGSSISVDPIADIVYGNNISVSFDGENLTVVNVVVRDKDNKIAYTTNVTESPFIIPVLPGGTYNLTLRNLGDKSYGESSDSVVFNILKAGSSISVDPIADVVYGDNVTVIFSADNLTEVNVTVKDMDNNTVDSFKVAYNFTITDLAVGTYNITLVNVESESFNESSCSTVFNVVKAGSSISVDPIADVVYGNDVSVSFTGENLTVVEVAVVDKDNRTVYSANVSSSPFSVPDLAAGVYNITLKNLGNENYTESSVSAVFNVVKAGSSISVDPIADVVYGNDVSVSFAGENLTVVEVAVVDKDNRTVYSANVTGNSFNVPVLPVGNYNITLRNMGNENYTESSASALFNITKAQNNATVIANNVVYGDYVTIIINATVDGVYTLNVNGTVMPVSVVGGIGSVSLDLDIGEYYAQADFDNDNYNTTYVHAIFNVLPVDKYDMAVDVSDALNGEDVTVTVSLPRKATGNVTVQVGNKNYTAKVVNGTATIKVPNMKAGNTTATVIYSGDDYYYSTAMTKVIHVKKVTISMSDAKYGWSKTITYKAKLTDEDGKALSNKEVVFSVAGKTIKAKTDAKGVATVKLSLKIGKHVIKLTSIYGNASRTITVVSRFSGNKNIKMYYFDGTKYTFKVYGDNGKLVGANQVVTVKLKKKTYKLKTNKNGVVKLTIPKTVRHGKYKITASYKGQTIKNTILVKQIMKPKKIVKVKKSAKKLVLKAKLRKKLKGKKIIFKFRGKKYKAKTNKKGIARVTIKRKVLKKLKIGKKYIAKASYYKAYRITKVKVIR